MPNTKGSPRILVLPITAGPGRWLMLQTGYLSGEQVVFTVCHERAQCDLLFDIRGMDGNGQSLGKTPDVIAWGKVQGATNEPLNPLDGFSGESDLSFIMRYTFAGFHKKDQVAIFPAGLKLGEVVMPELGNLLPVKWQSHLFATADKNKLKIGATFDDVVDNILAIAQKRKSGDGRFCLHLTHWVDEDSVNFCLSQCGEGPRADSDWEVWPSSFDTGFGQKVLLGWRTFAEFCAVLQETLERKRVRWAKVTEPPYADGRGRDNFYVYFFIAD